MAIKNTVDEVWQPIVDRAFEKLRKTEYFQTHNIDTERELLDSLDKVEKEAMVLGKFMQQVHNGGFAQWVDNGYAHHIDELIKALGNVGGSYSKKVIDLLESLLPYLDHNGNFIEEDEPYEECYDVDTGELDKYGDPIYEEECYDTWETSVPGWEFAYTLDTPFYNISKEWQEEVLEYLLKQANG